MANRRRTDNTMANRKRTDNTMANRRRTDNTMAKRRRTDNTMANRRRTLLLLAIVLSVLRYTDSDYPFGIFKSSYIHKD
jgi:hypothetical protein